MSGQCYHNCIEPNELNGIHRTTNDILHQLCETSYYSNSKGKTSNMWWFKHPNFICIGIFFYDKILHFFYCILFIIQIDGVDGCETKLLIDAICIIHQILHMKWVEDGSCAQKLCIISYNHWPKFLGNSCASFSSMFMDR
jgi:hypothetical protein